jgi:membrane-anchored mycosin MYCP
VAAGGEPLKQQWRRRAAALVVVVAGLSVVPVTPAAAAPRDEQWYLDRLGAPAAQAVSTGDGVLIGMFQSSVDIADPALGGRVRPAKRVGPGGAVQDIPPGEVSAAGRAADTGAAGLVVARGSDGLLGVAPGAQIQPINGPTGEEKASQALRWLTDQGAKVIDMSGGFTVDNDTERIDGIAYALSKDVVVMMDARRADDLKDSATTGVLVVAGLTEDNERDGTASFGSRVDLAAPGATLGLIGRTGERTNGPIATQGDIQACAITAGVVALVRAAHPELKAASVVDRLLGTAKDLGPAGRDSTYGAGLVDAAAAVTTDRPAVTANPLGDPGPPRDGGPTDRTIGLVAIAGAAVVMVLIVVGVILLVVRRSRHR